MFLAAAADCKRSSLGHQFTSTSPSFPSPSSLTSTMPAVFFRTRTSEVQEAQSSGAAGIRGGHYDGSCSDTDTEDGDDDECGDDDTIVRWGWVWHKGEMKRISELPQALVGCGDKSGAAARRQVSRDHSSASLIF
jgi:hypothetical protein